MRIVVLLAAAWGLSRSMPAVGDGPGTARPGPPAIAGAGPRTAAHPARTDDFFEARIRPILVEHCTRCHGPKKQESGLRLDSRAALLQGNDDGPVVMPGRPEESPIVEAVRYGATIKMPPAGKLPDRAIADLADWVKMGVPWPESPARPVSTSGAGVPNAAAIAEAARRHWAFRPVRDGTPPPVRDVGWPGIRSTASSWPGSRPPRCRRLHRPTGGP